MEQHDTLLSSVDRYILWKIKKEKIKDTERYLSKIVIFFFFRRGRKRVSYY